VSDPGGVVTGVPGGLRYQLTARPSRSDFFASAKIPITPFDVPTDARMWFIDCNIAVTTWNSHDVDHVAVYLVSDAGSTVLGTMPSGGGRLTKSAVQPYNEAALAPIVAGANLRFVIQVSVFNFLGTTAAALDADVTITDFKVTAQKPSLT
jgi:hypothetical protein